MQSALSAIGSGGAAATEAGLTGLDLGGSGAVAGMTGAEQHFAFFMSHNVIAVLYTSLEHVSNCTLWEACFPTAKVYMSKTQEHDPSVIDIENMKAMLLRIIHTNAKKE